MSTLTRDTTEEVFVSAEELATMFADVISMFRDLYGAWFHMLGHRRAVLLLAEHPSGHLFWLIAPATEGPFLSLWPWSDEGAALIDLDREDWPETVRWRLLARQPFTLAG